MRFCYAFRRFSDYPYLGNAFDMDPKRLSDKFLNRVKEMGFDGIELGMECLDRVGGEKKLSELATRLESFGTPVLAIRSGGLMIDPKTGEENVERVKRAIKFAKILNSEVINGAISGPPKSPYIDTGSKLIASASANQAGFYYSLKNRSQ